MAKCRFKGDMFYDAWRWDNDRNNRYPDWLFKASEDSVVTYRIDRGPELTIHTLRGELSVRLGDWILRGDNGELYQCSDEIFKKLYEPVDAIPEVSVSITLSNLAKIFELLEEIEHPKVWYCDTHLDMANEAIRYCAQTAIEIKALLPDMSHTHAD